MPVMTLSKKAGARLLLIVVLLGLTACATRVAYRFMDWAVVWRVERYVSLDSEQKATFKEAIKEFQEWHRTTQLVLYAEHMHELKQRLAKGSLTADEVHAETDKVQVLLDTSLQRSLPDGAALLASFSDDQVAELLTSLAEKHLEYIEERVNISPQQQIEERIDQLEDFFNPWLGRFTREQQGWVQDWAASLEPYEHLSAQQRKLGEAQLAELLKSRDNLDELEAGLRQLMFHRKDHWHPDLIKATDRNQAHTYALVAKLMNNLNSRQSRRLERKFNSYINDFLKLAGLDELPSKNKTQRPLDTPVTE